MFQKIINLGIYLIILSLPLYLIRFKLWWIPFTLLELMIYGLFVLWAFQKIQYFGLLDFLRKIPFVFNGSYLMDADQDVRRPSEKIQIINSKFQIPIFLIFIGLTISTLFSSDIQMSAGIWKGWFVAPLLFFIVFIDAIKNRTQIKKTLIALTLSGFLVALISLWHWFFGNLTYDGRLMAFYLSPNHLAMYLSPILILSFALWQFAKNKYQKTLLIIGYWLLVNVIYLTYSYGAWLGLIGAIVFLVVIKYKRAAFGQKKKILFYFFIALSFIILISFSLPRSEKTQNLFNFSRSSLESRLMIWQAAGKIIKDHPLIGIGPGMFQKYYLDYQSKFEPYLEWAAPQPHNLFLAFWLQAGLIGLIGFIWLLVRFFKICFQELLVTRYSLLVTGAMTYVLIHGLSDTTYWKNDLSIIFWLIIALSRIIAYLPYSRKTSNLLEGREATE